MDNSSGAQFFSSGVAITTVTSQITPKLSEIKQRFIKFTATVSQNFKQDTSGQLMSVQRIASGLGPFKGYFLDISAVGAGCPLRASVLVRVFVSA